MSLVDRPMTPAQVAASQANGRKGRGPNTAEGKARASLNSLKSGVYAKTERARREILVRQGECPEEFERWHQEFIEEWQPQHATEVLLVKNLAEKSFEAARLRAMLAEGELDGLRRAEIEAQQRQLLLRRLPAGHRLADPRCPPLWQCEDSLAKFKRIFDRLDQLQLIAEKRTAPEGLAGAIRDLYGTEDHTQAGEEIERLFIDLFGNDETAAAEAEAELPKRIAQERSDVAEERDLFRQESEIKEKVDLGLPEEEMSKKEAALEKQISEHTRLLLQLRTARLKMEWLTMAARASKPSSERQGPSSDAIARERQEEDEVGAESLAEEGSTGTQTAVCADETEKNGKMGETNLATSVESVT